MNTCKGLQLELAYKAKLRKFIQEHNQQLVDCWYAKYLKNPEIPLLRGEKLKAMCFRKINKNN
jgi:hypothetical protein